MSEYNVDWRPPMTKQQNSFRRIALKKFADRQVKMKLAMLDEAMELIRSIPSDNPWHRMATGLYAEWCELDQALMNEHIAILTKQLGRMPSTKEIYEDAP